MASDIVYSIATEADRTIIAEFICENFMRDETTRKAIELQVDESTFEFIQKDLDRSLKYPVSVIATDKCTGKVVGVRTTSLVDFKAVKQQVDCAYHEPTRDDKVNKLMTLDRLVENGLKTSQAAIGCDLLAKFEMLSVNREYRRRGIAQEMIRLSMDAATKLGCEGVYVIASAKALFDRLNFCPLKYISYQDHKDEYGRPIFVPKDRTEGTCLYFKML